MNKILKTKQLEFDKSVFLVDLIQHDEGVFYIEILQKIRDDQSAGYKLRINTSVFPELLSVLADFYEMIPNKTLASPAPSEGRINSLLRRYYKGITIKELSVQFDCSENLIEQILRINGAEIITPHKGQNRKWLRRSS